MRPLASIVALLLLLAGCAPAAIGSSSRAPLIIESGRQVEINRGGELFVRFELALDELGLSPRDLDGAFWIPAGVDGESANLATTVSLQDLRVPLRWSLELAEIRAVRNTESGRFGPETATTTYRIEPTIRLEVPGDAELGVSTVRFELVVRGGGRAALDVPVRVRAPAGP